MKGTSTMTSNPPRTPYSKHGILYQGQDYDGLEKSLMLTTGTPRQSNIKGVHGLAALYDLAVDLKLTHLWIHSSYNLEITEVPGADFDMLCTWKYPEDIAKTLSEPNPLVSCYGRRKYNADNPERFTRRSYSVYIIFLQHVLWDWPHDLPPDAILTLIDDLEAKLGVTLSGSPSGTGLRYLKQVNVRHPEWLDKPDRAILELPWDKAAKPLIWQRELTPGELERKYIVAVDKNGAYPRAAQEELFGVGQPLHVTGGEAGCATMLHEKMLPGMWHVNELRIADAVQHSFVAEGLIPEPLSNWHEEFWVASPMIKLMLKMGYEVQADEGYVFPQAQPVFKRYVEKLWIIRNGYASGTVERDSIKQVMNDLFGMLRSAKITDSPISRPDWYAMVVAGSRANMMYNIIKYALQGFFPFMVQMDALYFASDSPDPASIRGIMDHQGGLGGYKHKWTLPLTEEIKAVLRTTMAQSRKLQLLNALAANEVHHVR